jgi:hypothetical protein
MFVHDLPASIDLYTPSPQPELWRLVASPVPTQTTLGLDWLTVTQPSEATDAVEKTGVNVVPLSVVFHSPPVALAT